MDLNSGNVEDKGMPVPECKRIATDTPILPKRISIVSYKRAQTAELPKEIRRRSSRKKRKKRKMAKILKEEKLPLSEVKSDSKAGWEKTKVEPVIEEQLGSDSVESKEQEAYSPRSPTQNGSDTAGKQPIPDKPRQSPRQKTDAYTSPRQKSNSYFSPRKKTDSYTVLMKATLLDRGSLEPLNVGPESEADRIAREFWEKEEAERVAVEAKELEETKQANEGSPELVADGLQTLKEATPEEKVLEKELSAPEVKLENDNGSANDQPPHIEPKTDLPGSPALVGDGLPTVKAASTEEKVSEKELSTPEVKLEKDYGSANDEPLYYQPESDQSGEEKEILESFEGEEKSTQAQKHKIGESLVYEVEENKMFDQGLKVNDPFQPYPLRVDEKENSELDKVIVIPAREYPTSADDIRECQDEAQSLRRVLITRLVPAAVIVSGAILLYFILSHS